MVRSALFQWVVFASLGAVLLCSAQPPVRTNPLNEPIDSPARVRAPETDFSRVQRKPAVEPRVYVEDASARSGYAYYDYTDQPVPRQPQRPPVALERNGN